MDITENKLLKWALILGIIIVLNLFFAYTMRVVYNEPQFDDFCEQQQVIDPAETQQECTERGGQWNANVRKEPVPVNMEFASEGYCDLQFTCRNEYQDAREMYERNVFMTLIALGVISIIAGFFFATQQILSVAFSLGGVLTFVWASIRYWQFASEYLQVGILGLALAVLIYLAYRKFK